jgi:hypothetical protein
MQQFRVRRRLIVESLDLLRSRAGAGRVGVGTGRYGGCAGRICPSHRPPTTPFFNDPWTVDARSPSRPVSGWGCHQIGFEKCTYSYVIRKGFPQFETSSNSTQTTKPDNPGRPRRLKFPSIRTYPGWSRITGYPLGAGGRRFDPGRPDQHVGFACSRPANASASDSAGRGLDRSPGPFAALRLPRREAPPLWETPRAATRAGPDTGSVSGSRVHAGVLVYLAEPASRCKRSAPPSWVS